MRKLVIGWLEVIPVLAGMGMDEINCMAVLVDRRTVVTLPWFESDGRSTELTVEKPHYCHISDNDNGTRGHLRPSGLHRSPTRGSTRLGERWSHTSTTSAGFT